MRKAIPAWTPFIRQPDRIVPEGASDKVRRAIECQEVYMNSQYRVHVVHNITNGFNMGGITWLSINNVDRNARHDWRDFQRLKNELTDPERDAVEIYPAESRLQDTADQFHLWVFPLGTPFPMGFKGGRSVSETPGPGGSQRKFAQDGRPDDILTAAQLEAKGLTIEIYGATNEDEAENTDEE